MFKIFSLEIVHFLYLVYDPINKRKQQNIKSSIGNRF